MTKQEAMMAVVQNEYKLVSGCVIHILYSLDDAISEGEISDEEINTAIEYGLNEAEFELCSSLSQNTDPAERDCPTLLQEYACDRLAAYAEKIRNQLLEAAYAYV